MMRCLHVYTARNVLTSYARLQVGVCFQCSRNLVSYEFICQARTRVNFVIGEWQQAHHLVHSQSVQPGFIMRQTPDDGLVPMEYHPVGAASAAQGDGTPVVPSSAQASDANAALLAGAAQASQMLST